MKVVVPPYHVSAVGYTFKCLLGEILGVDYTLEESADVRDFELTHDGRKVTLANAFFADRSREELYRSAHIPSAPEDGFVTFRERRFPVVTLYGTHRVEWRDATHVHVHSDLIGGAFFMLSRWEESVVEARDEHDRFDFRQSVAVRHGFYHRPIVDEYAELIFALCKFLDPEVKRKDHVYRCVVTSDIDELRKWKKPKILMESIYLHLGRGKIRHVFHDLANYARSLLAPKRDHYNNLDYLLSATKGLPRIFYFKTRYSHPRHDKNRYRLGDYREELDQCETKDVDVGIHPHYHAFLDREEIAKGRSLLERETEGAVRKVRQHYFRFAVPTTWRAQAAAGLKEDSTMLYAHRGGFRVGTCHRFPVYDFVRDEELGMYESPPILMETSYLNLGFDELLKDAERLIEQVKRYRGNFVILWHNGNLVYADQRKYFEKLLALAAPDVDD